MNKQHVATGNGRNGKRSMPRRQPLAATIIAALLLAPFAVQAQDTTPPPAQDTAADEEVVELDEVVVTANKRSENIRDVASSITVIGGERLEDIGARQLTDYAAYVPGLQVSSMGTPGRTQASMRGIAPLSSGSTVGTYIDETPLGSSGIYQAAVVLALDLLPYDIERVEVLRGPQGTLYGAGSMGGLLKYVTRAPDVQENEFRFGGGFANVDGAGDLGTNWRVGGNLALVEDSLALRFSFAGNHLPGYIDNLVNGEEDLNSADQSSARVAMLWQGQASSVQFTALQQTVDSENNALVALDATTGEPIGDDQDGILFVDEPFEKDIDYLALTWDWDLGFADFTSATGYSDTRTRIRLDATIPYGEFLLAFGGPDVGSSWFDNGLDLEKLTQEFRLTSKQDGAFEWLVGGFYSHEDGGNTQDIYQRQLDGSALPPLPPPYTGFTGTLARLQLPTEYTEVALFANGDYHFTDRFTLGAGVRYAENRQDYAQDVYGGILLPIAVNENSSKEDVFTWSLTPQFELGDDSLLYAKIATGYQPGGPNVAVPGVPPQVDSSMLTSYEIGLKTSFADDAVLLDVAAFRIDWDDIQVITSYAGNNGLVNGGKAKSQGIEFSAQFRPTAALQFGLNAAYTDADVAEDFETVYIPAGPYIVALNTGLAGDRLPYVPEWQWSATADWYFPVGSWDGHVGGGFRWVDDRVASTTERQVITEAAPPGNHVATVISPPLELGSYHSLDLYASVSNETLTFRGYVKNATGDEGYSSIGTVSSALTGELSHLNAVPVQPRTFGLEFDVRF